MPADTGIATRLRAAGLEVREVAGWKTRANSSGLAAFNPKGGVNHHTAMPSSVAGDIPSLNILVNGRSDLRGPLCNVALSRSGIFYVVAAGPANHAGLPDGGSIKGMTGNSTAYGMEIEHDGVHPLEAKRVALAARAWAAIFRRGNIPASQLVQHWEWAPSRKIDLATNMHGSDKPSPTAAAFRTLVADEIKKLNEVKLWTVSFKNQKGDRIESKIADVKAWTEQHPKPYQRGRVYFTPKRS